MENCTLPYRFALKRLGRLANIQSDKYNVPFQFVNDYSIWEAETHYDVKTGLAQHVYVGLAGLKDDSFLSFINAKVSYENFAQVVLNIFHEATHCEQRNVIFQKSNATIDEINQAINAVACFGNKTYYRGFSNYYINPNEIQAEYYGVMSTYQYLCDTFSEIDKEQHEQIVLNIVNRKSKPPLSYWIRSSKAEGFTSLSEVEAAFQSAYEESFMCKRMYKINNSSCKDDVTRHACKHDEDSVVYIKQEIGTDQDRVIAAINCHIHPEYQNQCMCLSNVDLSYKTNIEKPFQKIQYEKEEHIYGRIRNVEAKFGHILKADVEQQVDNPYGD